MSQVAGENAVEHHDVKVDFQVDARAESLHVCRCAVRGADALLVPSPRAGSREDRFDEDSSHGRQHVGAEAASARRSNGSESTHWRMGTAGSARSTKCAATLAILVHGSARDGRTLGTDNGTFRKFPPWVGEPAWTTCSPATVRELAQADNPPPSRMFAPGRRELGAIELWNTTRSRARWQIARGDGLARCSHGKGSQLEREEIEEGSRDRGADFTDLTLSADANLPSKPETPAQLAPGIGVDLRKMNRVGVASSPSPLFVVARRSLGRGWK
jgi:hypothetical protein